MIMISMVRLQSWGRCSLVLCLCSCADKRGRAGHHGHGFHPRGPCHRSAASLLLSAQARKSAHSGVCPCSGRRLAG